MSKISHVSSPLPAPAYLSTTWIAPVLSIGLLLGIGCLQLFDSIQTYQILSVFLFLVMSVGLTWAVFKRAPVTFFYLTLFYLAMGLGFSRAWWQAHQGLAYSFPVMTERVQAEVTGCISSIPTQNEKLARFLFDVVDDPVKGYRIKRLRVSLYQNSSETDLALFTAGSCWNLPLRIKTNRGLRNTGLFDYEGWLFRQGIGATAYVKGAAKNLNQSRFPLLKLRAHIAHQIEQSIGQYESLGLVLGLTLGLRDHLEPKDWQVLQRTGTSHLLAISGLHIGIAALFGYYLGKLLWLGLSIFKRPRYTPNQYGMLISACFALFYTALAGFSVPTQRACIMLFCAYSALFSRRRFALMTILSFALCIVLLLDPSALLSMGTWLSFLAVGVLVYFTKRDREVQSARMNRCKLGHAVFSKMKKGFSLQFLLVIFLSLPVAMSFGLVSATAPVVNLLMIPIFTFSVVPLLLLAVVVLPLTATLAAELFRIQAVWLEIVWELLSRIAAIEPGAFEFHLSFFWSVVFLILLVPWLLPRRILPRGLSLLLLLPLIFGFKLSRQNSALEMQVFDVGQGLAILVKTKNHTLLYDTGPAYRSGSSATERVVIPMLEKQGISSLSALVISHSDNDHAGGLHELRERISVEHTYSPELDSVPQSLPCVSGASWEWDAVEFKFLYPFNDTRATDNNNLSCVLKISYKTSQGEQQILLTGDIEKKAEYALVSSATNVKASILIAPHHGSATSSTEGFARAVSPDMVVYSTGFANPWGFPKANVRSNWQAVNRQLQEFNTANSGNIIFTLDKDANWQVKTWQEHHCRYWHLDCE